MNELQFLIDLHRPANRQGPGGDAETELILKLAGLDQSLPLKIADIGCGTGASTLLLAKKLDAVITAVDYLQDFLDELQLRAKREELCDKIVTINCSMGDLPFASEEFDVIWSEGAIYNIGFEAGISAWKHFLKPNGKLIISEITWISSSRPLELENYWKNEYQEIDTESAKIEIIKKSGFSLEAYFVLPNHCWVENYYRPMQERFIDFLGRHPQSDQAKLIVEAEQREIALYEKYNSYYSYGVYIAKKCAM